ncbi:Trp biosynthesis-associated membrane protein [Nocardioides ochotonae]|uniref:Trp biosynthesis-associated membrane protein n=1 Tax=Nocardioides ochotonae TaxID=2685869 RepID=UPI00140A5BED|nr:Trp biosynthesis-associated membrane protein [Nocardioides ochotonae]
MSDARPRARRSFGPVVLAGLAGAGLAAFAGTKPWARIDEGSTGAAFAPMSDSAGESPLAASLALVVLACWGVVLVTRGIVRRAVLALSVLAAAATVVTVAVGWSQTAAPLRDALDAVGLGGSVSHTWWWAAALAGALVALAAGVAGVRLASAWPEMGRRYDAPTGGPVADAARPAEEQSNLDLWKAMDEGHDPTA